VLHREQTRRKQPLNSEEGEGAKKGFGRASSSTGPGTAPDGADL